MKIGIVLDLHELTLVLHFFRMKKSIQGIRMKSIEYYCETERLAI
jgi:hypothetical protein